MHFHRDVMMRLLDNEDFRGLPKAIGFTKADVKEDGDDCRPQLAKLNKFIQEKAPNDLRMEFGAKSLPIKSLDVYEVSEGVCVRHTSGTEYTIPLQIFFNTLTMSAVKHPGQSTKFKEGDVLQLLTRATIVKKLGSSRHFHPFENMESRVYFRVASNLSNGEFNNYRAEHAGDFIFVKDNEGRGWKFNDGIFKKVEMNWENIAIEMAKGRIRERILREKNQELETLDQQYNSYMNEISTLLRRMSMADKSTDIETKVEKIYSGINDAVTKMMEIPIIKSAENTGHGKYRIFTKPIVCHSTGRDDRKRCVGEYRIELNIFESPSALAFNVTDGRNYTNHTGTNHPHVKSSGQLCIGNFGGQLKDAIQNFDPVTMLEVVLALLSSYYEASSFSRAPVFCEDPVIARLQSLDFDKLELGIVEEDKKKTKSTGDIIAEGIMRDHPDTTIEQFDALVQAANTHEIELPRPRATTTTGRFARARASLRGSIPDNTITLNSQSLLEASAALRQVTEDDF